MEVQKKKQKIVLMEENMKYQTFQSACSYAGLANLLDAYNVDTQDYKIALDLKLPYMFRYLEEQETYLAGAMLQGGKWFNLYLNPLGFLWKEEYIAREQITTYLQELSKMVLLDLKMQKNCIRSMIYQAYQDGKYEFKNIKYEFSMEPDVYQFTEEELLTKIDSSVMIGYLEEIEKKEVPLREEIENSISALQRYKKEIVEFCSTKKTVRELNQSMNTLFRPFILDLYVMLDLVKEQELLDLIFKLQKEYTDALAQKEDLILADSLSMDLLEEAIDCYMEFIKKDETY